MEDKSKDNIFTLNADNPAIRELQAAAFETLLFFPGIDFIRWCQVLLKEYTEEVVDALGDDAEGVMEDLQELWNDTVYTDPSTDISKKYCEWSALLKDQRMVDYYYKLLEEANAAKGIK